VLGKPINGDFENESEVLIHTCKEHFEAGFLGNGVT
jgi:hypothetical protein